MQICMYKQKQKQWQHILHYIKLGVRCRHRGNVVKG